MLFLAAACCLNIKLVAHTPVLPLTTLIRLYKAPKPYLARTRDCARIYVLVDPRNGEVRYVGRTVNAESRYAAHRAKRTASFHVDDWKRHLLQFGWRPLMYTISKVIRSKVELAERHAIRHCLGRGAELLNWNHNYGARWSRRQIRLRAGPDPTGEWRSFLVDYRDHFE